MNYNDPIKTAKGLGSSKSGFSHWWTQRLTAMVLALLTPYMVYCLARYGVADYALLKQMFSNPVFSGVMLLYVMALFWHARLGLQVVVEDYIHSPGLEVALQVAIKLIFSLAAVVAVIAIVQLALSV